MRGRAWGRPMDSFNNALCESQGGDATLGNESGQPDETSAAGGSGCVVVPARMPRFIENLNAAARAAGLAARMSTAPSDTGTRLMAGWTGT